MKKQAMRKPAKPARGPRNRPRGPRKTLKGAGKAGFILRALRVHRGLTQQKLNQRLGVTQSVLSHAESKDDVRLSTLSSYARACGARMVISFHFRSKKIESLHLTIPFIEKAKNQKK